MKVGVLSDTHDEAANLELVLDAYRQLGISQLIHCGDMIGPEIVRQLEGFQVIYVDGNMDRDSGEIYRALREIDPHSVMLPTFEGEIDGVSIAVTHGDDLAELERVIRSGIHRFAFTGHTHRRRDETIGPTRVLNPGALGGLQFEPRSYSVVDLTSGEVELFEL